MQPCNWSTSSDCHLATKLYVFWAQRKWEIHVPMIASCIKHEILVGTVTLFHHPVFEQDLDFKHVVLNFDMTSIKAHHLFIDWYFNICSVSWSVLVYIDWFCFWICKIVSFKTLLLVCPSYSKLQLQKAKISNVYSSRLRGTNSCWPQPLAGCH